MGGKSIEELVRDEKGINIHGHSLRISFQYQGSRLRETLSLEPTRPNLKYAVNLRAAVLHDINTGTFDYIKRFPESKNAVKYGSGKKSQSIRVGELANKYMSMKESDIGIQSVRVYHNSLDQCVESLGEDRVFSHLTGEDILVMRNVLIATRKARTVNSYLVIFRGFLEFALDNGYTDSQLYKSAKPFKTAADDPDPFEIEEYQTIINIGCTADVDKNLVTTAVYTGLRSGELCALSWEDIDFDKKTLTVKRTITVDRKFKLPKSHESRIVHLMPPALAALKAQRIHTLMMPAVIINVHQVDKTQTKQYKVRPVFRPGLSRIRSGCNYEPWFTVMTLSQKWRLIIKRSGVRYRIQYQTRHTYACWGLTSHGNSSFIANQMGHRDLSMLFKVYGRWMESSSKSEADFIWSELNKKGHNVETKTKVSQL